MSEKFVNTLLKIFGQPTAKRPIFVLSPHLDDAVWSLGGLLSYMIQAGYKLEVITIFSQSAFVYDELISPEQATSIRKAENIVALRNVGIHHTVCLDMPEGVLRDRSLDAIFDATYTLPAHLDAIISEHLLQLIPEGAAVLVPGSFGEHMDHMAVRAIASKLPYKIIYYEDLPYAARPVRVTEALKYVKERNCAMYRLPANDMIIETHLKRYSDYVSQSKAHHIEQIKEHLTQKGYGLWMN